MTLPKEFVQKLKSRTTDDLRLITSRPKEYTPEALQAVRDELTRRGETVETLTTKSEESSISGASDLQENENVPLEWPLRIACIAGLGLVLFFVLSAGYKNSGYKRKANELVEWTLYGVVIIVLLVSLNQYLAPAPLRE